MFQTLPRPSEKPKDAVSAANNIKNVSNLPSQEARRHLEEINKGEAFKLLDNRLLSTLALSSTELNVTSGVHQGQNEKYQEAKGKAQQSILAQMGQIIILENVSVPPSSNNPLDIYKQYLTENKGTQEEIEGATLEGCQQTLIKLGEKYADATRLDVVGLTAGDSELQKLRRELLGHNSEIVSLFIHGKIDGLERPNIVAGMAQNGANWASRYVQRFGGDAFWQSKLMVAAREISGFASVTQQRDLYKGLFDRIGGSKALYSIGPEEIQTHTTQYLLKIATEVSDIQDDFGDSFLSGRNAEIVGGLSQIGGKNILSGQMLTELRKVAGAGSLDASPYLTDIAQRMSDITIQQRKTIMNTIDGARLMDKASEAYSKEHLEKSIQASQNLYRSATSGITKGDSRSGAHNPLEVARTLAQQMVTKGVNLGTLVTNPLGQTMAEVTTGVPYLGPLIAGIMNPVTALSAATMNIDQQLSPTEFVGWARAKGYTDAQIQDLLVRGKQMAAEKYDQSIRGIDFKAARDFLSVKNIDLDKFRNKDGGVDFGGICKELRKFGTFEEARHAIAYLGSIFYISEGLRTGMPVVGDSQLWRKADSMLTVDREHTANITLSQTNFDSVLAEFRSYTLLDKRLEFKDFEGITKSHLTLALQGGLTNAALVVAYQVGSMTDETRQMATHAVTSRVESSAQFLDQKITGGKLIPAADQLMINVLFAIDNFAAVGNRLVVRKGPDGLRKITVNIANANQSEVDKVKQELAQQGLQVGDTVSLVWNGKGQNFILKGDGNGNINLESINNNIVQAAFTDARANIVSAAKGQEGGAFAGDIPADLSEREVEPPKDLERSPSIRPATEYTAPEPVVPQFVALKPEPVVQREQIKPVAPTPFVEPRREPVVPQFVAPAPAADPVVPRKPNPIDESKPIIDRFSEPKTPAKAIVPEAPRISTIKIARAEQADPLPPEQRLGGIKPDVNKTPTQVPPERTSTPPALNQNLVEISRNIATNGAKGVTQEQFGKLTDAEQSALRREYPGVDFGTLQTSNIAPRPIAPTVIDPNKNNSKPANNSQKQPDAKPITGIQGKATTEIPAPLTTDSQTRKVDVTSGSPLARSIFEGSAGLDQTIEIMGGREEFTKRLNQNLADTGELPQQLTILAKNPNFPLTPAQSTTKVGGATLGEWQEVFRQSPQVAESFAKANQTTHITSFKTGGERIAKLDFAAMVLGLFKRKFTIAGSVEERSDMMVTADTTFNMKSSRVMDPDTFSLKLPDSQTDIKPETATTINGIPVTFTLNDKGLTSATINVSSNGQPFAEVIINDKKLLNDLTKGVITGPEAIRRIQNNPLTVFKLAGSGNIPQSVVAVGDKLTRILQGDQTVNPNFGKTFGEGDLRFGNIKPGQPIIVAANGKQIDVLQTLASTLTGGRDGKNNGALTSLLPDLERARNSMLVTEAVGSYAQALQSTALTDPQKAQLIAALVEYRRNPNIIITSNDPVFRYLASVSQGLTALNIRNLDRELDAGVLTRGTLGQIAENLGRIDGLNLIKNNNLAANKRLLEQYRPYEASLVLTPNIPANATEEQEVLIRLAHVLKNLSKSGRTFTINETDNKTGSAADLSAIMGQAGARAESTSKTGILRQSGRVEFQAGGTDSELIAQQQAIIEREVALNVKKTGSLYGIPLGEKSPIKDGARAAKLIFNVANIIFPFAVGFGTTKTEGSSGPVDLPAMIQSPQMQNALFAASMVNNELFGKYLERMQRDGGVSGGNGYTAFEAAVSFAQKLNSSENVKVVHENGQTIYEYLVGGETIRTTQKISPTEFANMVKKISIVASIKPGSNGIGTQSGFLATDINSLVLKARNQNINNMSSPKGLVDRLSSKMTNDALTQVKADVQTTFNSLVKTKPSAQEFQSLLRTQKTITSAQDLFNQAGIPGGSQIVIAGAFARNGVTIGGDSTQFGKGILISNEGLIDLKAGKLVKVKFIGCEGNDGAVILSNINIPVSSETGYSVNNTTSSAEVRIPSGAGDRLTRKTYVGVSGNLPKSQPKEPNQPEQPKRDPESPDRVTEGNPAQPIPISQQPGRPPIVPNNGSTTGTSEVNLVEPPLAVTPPAVEIPLVTGGTGSPVLDSNPFAPLAPVTPPVTPPLPGTIVNPIDPLNPFNPVVPIPPSLPPTSPGFPFAPPPGDVAEGIINMPQPIAPNP